MACLEDGSRPEDEVMASFLINALYLIGDQRILAYGGLPSGVEERLVRLGHRIESDSRGRNPATRPDRAVAVRTLGRGGVEEILESLRAMGKALRPGGLLAFQLVDRDRAWGLAGERRMVSGKAEARLRVEFDPGSGRLSARTLEIKDPASGMGLAAPAGGASASLQTFNLSEIGRVLRSAGLVLERAYADWNGGSPETEGAATGRLVIVAAKPRRPRTGRRAGNLSSAPAAPRLPRPGSS